MFLSRISRIIGIPELLGQKNSSLIKGVLGKHSYTILSTWKITTHAGVLKGFKKEAKPK